MKAGRWTRIQEFVNKHLPNYSSGFSRLRGLAVPLDLFLTGKTRFARKIGEFLPVIQPDNASDLVEDLLDNGRVAVLDEPLRWIQYGSLMRFPVSGEMVLVQDISVDGTQVQFQEAARSNHTTGERLELFGHPVLFNAFAGSAPISTPGTHSGTAARITNKNGDWITVEGLTDISLESVGNQLLLTGTASPLNSGAFEILQVLSDFSVVVHNPAGVAPDANNGTISWIRANPIYTFDSTQPIYNGDELWLNHRYYNVVRSVVVGPIPPDDTRYLVTLDKVLPDDLQQDSTVYLRAYPAYESPILPIPEIPFSSRSLGPGLIDWISGPLYEDALVAEVQNYRVFNSAMDVLTEYTSIEKNFVESRLPIEADSFLFFKPTRGRIGWDGTRYVMTTDSRNEFHSHYTMIPNLAFPDITEWTTQVQPTVNTRLVIEMEEAGRQTWNLIAGVETTIRIQVNKPFTRIHIGFRGEPNGELRMRGWSPANVQRTAAVQHVLIGKVTGRYDWAAAGLFYKPYWLSLDYIKVRLDQRSMLDRGLLVL